MFFVPATYAQTASQQGTAELINTVLIFGLIFLVFYFLVIRPQQRKVRLHRKMLAALQRGDRVVTAGGIIGTVTKVVSLQEVIIELTENVKVKVVRDTITSVLAKSEFSSDKAKAEKSNVCLSNGGVNPLHSKDDEKKGKISLFVEKLLGK